MADRPRVYWETCPFIAEFTNEVGRGHICHAVLLSAQKGEIELDTSMLTLVEIFKIPGTPEEQAAEKRISEFFRNRWI